MSRAGRFGSLLLWSITWPAMIQAAAVPLASSEAKQKPSIRMPEGIADSEGRVGYFASSSDGIEAVDLANGKVLWHTHEAQRPLFLDGDHLLAQAGTKRNRLRILRLDVKRNGECSFESDPLVFPPWIVTGEAHGHSFVTHWHKEKHHLVLDWQASAWYAGKSRPTSEETQSARKHASGIARIDLRTGQIEILPPPGEPAASAAGLTAPPPLPEQLEQKALRWQKLIGQHWKVLALEEEKGQQCLVLHSWDRQKEAEQQPQELMRGRRLLVRTTVDEQILCLREANPNPDEQVSLTQRRQPNWWLFAVQTGKLIGSIADEAGMNTLVVLDQHMFYLVPGTLRGQLDHPNVQPQLLRAVDLSTGKKIWERPVAGKLIAPPPF